MITFIRTAHEEEYSNKSRTLGVLLNLDKDFKRVDSLLYIFHDERYIFFNTIMDMNEYLLYGGVGNFKTAYLTEEDFDVFWDAPHIDGLFTDQLKWL